MTNICVFASGTGSNFKSIHSSTIMQDHPGKIVLLVSNNPNCGAVKYASQNDIQTEIFNTFRYPDITEYSDNLLQVLNRMEIELILLAGYIKKIPDKIVDTFNNKILNIHPALLPKFGGRGFFGMKVHEAVIQSGEIWSGVTIHFVNKEYDCGPILVQKSVSVHKEDTAETLSNRVLEVEHKIYPEAVKAFCENRIKWINNKPEILEN